MSSCTDVCVGARSPVHIHRSSDRLLGSIITLKNHFWRMSSVSELAFCRVQVINQDDDGMPPPSQESTGSTSVPNASIESSSLILTATEDETEYANIKLNNELWMQRIQDTGCSYDMLPKKHYMRSKIPPIGPKESPMFYFHISAIAIDYLKKLSKESELGRGWKKVPVNRTDGKNKIINILLATRKIDTNGTYQLDQGRVIAMLANVWGGDSGEDDSAIHPNDRLRVYGLIMSIEIHRDLFQRLAEGVSRRQHLDDPVYSLKQIFQTIAFAFNNEKIVLELPDESYDIVGHEEMDLNQLSRIKITRDCKFVTRYLFNM